MASNKRTDGMRERVEKYGAVEAPSRQPAIGRDVHEALWRRAAAALGRWLYASGANWPGSISTFGMTFLAGTGMVIGVWFLTL